MVWRIHWLVGVAALGAAVISPSWAQGPGPAEPQAGEVRVLVQLQGSGVNALDITYPAPVTVADINNDLREVNRWTGWATATPKFDDGGGASSVSAQVLDAPTVGGVLNDVVWPLVAALADHGKLTIIVMGATVSTMPLRLETGYATVEQSGGQGVQTYQALVKQTGFRTLDELRRPTARQAAAASRARTGGGVIALLWLCVVVASVAAGAIVYLTMSRSRR